MKNAFLILSSLLLVSCSSNMKKSDSCCRDHSNPEFKRSAPYMSESEMMSMVTEFAKPAEEHTVLNSLVGKWKTVSKIYSPGSVQPKIEKGSAVHTWILGKRFIREEFSGQWMGKKFSGVGTFGFDKGKKKYVADWMDTMGTGIMASEGTFNPADKTLTMGTSYYCPVSGAMKNGKNVTRILSDKVHVFEMYDTDQDGKEYKMMEITYTKTK